MRSLPLCFLLVILCACSQSVQITQPPTTPTAHIATDTIDFGTDPLWREADTTVWIALSNHNAITSLVISDSDFTLLDTSRVNDSLRISLRFQPQSLANHSGVCLLLSKQDTLARLKLLGGTSAFVRHLGDKYIYQSLAGFDTITIRQGDRPFLAAGITLIDSYINEAGVNISGDIRTLQGGWPAETCKSGSLSDTLHGVQHYSTLNEVEGCEGDTTVPLFGSKWTCSRPYFYKHFTDYYSNGQPTGLRGSEGSTGIYCSAFKFFYSLSGNRSGDGAVQMFLIRLFPDRNLDGSASICGGERTITPSSSVDNFMPTVKRKKPKETAIKAIKELKESASYEDIMYEMYVLQKIERGRKDVREGRIVTHDEAKKRLSKWLK